MSITIIPNIEEVIVNANSEGIVNFDPQDLELTALKVIKQKWKMHPRETRFARYEHVIGMGTMYYNYLILVQSHPFDLVVRGFIKFKSILESLIDQDIYFTDISKKTQG